MRHIQELPPIVFIGAGNLATNLAVALNRNGIPIAQVYSRTEDSAIALAGKVYCPYTTDIESIITGACIYICAISDNALIELIPRLTNGRESSLWVHTAGSLPMEVWGNLENYGVFYPLQTFSKNREVDFSKIPFFIEANNEKHTGMLIKLAKVLSDKVYGISSAQRMKLHLAAVFACNFTNYMYTVAADIVSEEKLPFEILLPLIDETASKVHELSPEQAQTGPAVRFDRNIIGKHLDILKEYPDIQRLYELLSTSIYTRKNQ